jgi:hypothetical protein
VCDVRTARVHLFAILLAALATTVHTHGLTAQLPMGWQVAPRPLTTTSDPRERMSVGTYPLRYRPVGCDHLPSSALLDLGPRDALVTLLERHKAHFPRRPAHFGPHRGDRSEASECVPRARFTDHWFTFRDNGRNFHVLVAFGPHAPAATRRQAWGILDGLRVARRR